jgi:tetratricopeptide (TPR) repeat protein
MFFSCGIVLSIVFAGGIARETLAQDGGESEVTLGFVITDSEEVPAPPVRVRRIYGEPRQLRFGFSITNRYTSKVPVLVDTGTIKRTVGLILERETELPVAFQWLDGQITVNEEPTALPPVSWVRLDPKESLGWTIVAERADGRPFERGQYYLTAGFMGVRSAVRTTEGTPWRGKVSEGIGQWSLLVGPPTSSAERVRMHEIAGGAAMGRGDLERALAEYTQLLEVDPANVNAQVYIGHIHAQSGRYREAITWWERVAPNARGDSHHPVRLAYAYVAAGEDDKAGEVLRAAAFDEERVALELDRARRGAIERPIGVARPARAAQAVAPPAAVAIAPDEPAPDPQQLLFRLRETAQREAARRKGAQP